MNRPLIITDCDEVLLHMVVPLRDWLDAEHGIHFDFHSQGFGDALRHKESGKLVEQALIWTLLTAFFETEMHRQTPIAGAMEAMARLSEIADIVVLTNIGEAQHALRVAQIRSHGLDCPVFWNRGGKGPKLSAILAERQPSVALFIDDLGENHASVADHAPNVWRLHFIGEPQIAPQIPTCATAHARIDDWPAAEVWIRERIAQGPASGPATQSPSMTETDI